MPAPTPQPANSRWCDIQGTHIDLSCRVEQVTERAEPGILPSRLYQHGQVVGRGVDSLYVRFADNVVVGLPAQVLRLLASPCDHLINVCRAKVIAIGERE